MSDEVEPGLSDQYRKASPWPMFVALGFVLSEVGVVLGFFPVTVGGLLLFGGSVAGILREAEYTSRLSGALGLLGVVLAALGVAVVFLQVGLSDLSIGVLLDRTRPFVYRAAAVTTAGLFLVVLAAVTRLLHERPAR